MAEIIVAIFIILTALGSIATLVTFSLHGQRVSQDSVIAYNLAREGIEVLRAMRDNAFTSGLRQTTCTAGCTTLRDNIADHDAIIQMVPASTTNPFLLNYDGSSALFFTLNSGNVMCLYNGLGPYYQRQGGCLAGDTVTPFRRRVTIDYICLDPDPASATYKQECVESNNADAGCGLAGGACTAAYSQLVGFRVRSRVMVVGRPGSAGAGYGSTECEVAFLEDYLYVWK